MRISSPALVVYGCTFVQATNLVHAHQLRNCEPEPWLVRGIWFSHEKDLVAFMLQFREEIDFEDHLAIVFPGQQKAVGAFISEYEMEGRVTRSDLVAVRFWDTEDQKVFEAALDL
jgi:hypothetical protein